MSTHTINPALLTWARERAEISLLLLEKSFPQLSAWEAGTEQPTLKQLEEFARAVHIPIGYLFLQAPIDEPLPIADFRTMKNRSVVRPSPDMLAVLYICQQRQAWYQVYARKNAFSQLDFIGSATISDTPEIVAESMRQILEFLPDDRNLTNWEEALRHLISLSENRGILVMTSGIVGNNIRRKLKVEEFRGFVLADKIAPLIFINGSDSKAAQMFTLAHELSHLWLGKVVFLIKK